MIPTCICTGWYQFEERDSVSSCLNCKLIISDQAQQFYLSWLWNEWPLVWCLSVNAAAAVIVVRGLVNSILKENVSAIGAIRASIGAGKKNIPCCQSVLRRGKMTWTPFEKHSQRFRVCIEDHVVMEFKDEILKGYCTKCKKVRDLYWVGVLPPSSLCSSDLSESDGDPHHSTPQRSEEPRARGHGVRWNPTFCASLNLSGYYTF